MDGEIQAVIALPAGRATIAPCRDVPDAADRIRAALDPIAENDAVKGAVH
ncbi:MAG TPA: hypothetical protein VGN98_02005 [Tianweitania sediminis]|nr:hypothetical protein [Tianweitania sediminis]